MCQIDASADLLACNGSHSKSFACVPMGEGEVGNGIAIQYNHTYERISN